MIEFFDTSVLIAAGQTTHVHHEQSFRQLTTANKTHSACAAHTLAEVYASITAIPLRPRIPPGEALIFVHHLCARLTPITLQAEEYLNVIQDAAERGLTSGKIYDALLLACATKAGAEVIYTWNLKHFRAIAPHLAERIQNP